MDGVPADAASLVSQLTAIAAQLALLPNYNLTAAAMPAIAAANTQASAPLASLGSSLATAVASIAALPNLTAVAGALTSFAVQLQGFSFAQLQADVIGLNGTVAALPPLPPLLAQLTQLGAVPASLPCLAGCVALCHASPQSVTNTLPAFHTCILSLSLSLSLCSFAAVWPRTWPRSRRR